MAQPYVGEIRMFAGNFAPAGWMFCEGQLMPISEYETLFNLIGTTYGGDGQSTFALPDLRGRIPVHQGTGGGLSPILAETGGVEEVTLTTQQIPNHSHPLLAVDGRPGTQASPAGNLPAMSLNVVPYVTATPGTAGSDDDLGQLAVTGTGGSQPHTNFQPYLCVDFIISLFGIFPSPT
ncbi:phage tail protein [Nocardioides nitrophenolicus]|uniref:phage tail protein n=1 Tax=Nocardioides nitrophenolicus TaxID=60489 RepID=UPI000A4A35FB|nr:tail fiber protein [Nocardioides nitrophenolicus]MBM7519777.1 microcystin-dependent protein [Nocardioides nitrophenolicus]